MNIGTTVISRGPSIFTSRNNGTHKLEDCVICIPDTNNRNQSTIAKIYACESGELVRDYEAINPEITLDFLLDNALIDSHSDEA